MDIVAFREQIAAIVAKNESRIGEESKELEREFGIDPADVLENAICNIEDENRLLQIGIIGRVKAGKSSLLNALLFDGENILPKAATPMTAALTQISYGDELCAEVEFFSRKDIEEIGKNHQEYTKKLNKLIDEKINAAKGRNKPIPADIFEKSRKQAQRDLNGNAGLSSAYDQYERMKSSGVIIDSLKDMGRLSAKDIYSLSQQLLEYVGSEGRYMPFTKSVHIKLPKENLQGIQIVDTPGLNDPVQSREDRTRELLKYCDVIFIVSPSGQFLSIDDTDLMDRITTKEGVNNIFVISSQVDNQLMGDEKEKGNGDLHQVLKNIIEKLGKHLSTTLTQLKKNSPEVGTTFDQLIEQGQQCVIHSSGICQTLKTQFDSKELWDSGAKKVWENLTHNYPDYFSNDDKNTSLANLDLLGNINEIKKIIAMVRVRKQEIIEKRKEEFCHAKSESLLKFQEKIISFCKDKIYAIKNSDGEKLKQEKMQLEYITEDVSDILDSKYSDLVESLEVEIKRELKRNLESYYNNAKNSIDDEKQEKTESYEVSTSSWYNPFSWGGKETKYNTYKEVRSGAVRIFLESLTQNIEKTIKDESQVFMMSWKKSLRHDITVLLRDAVSNKDYLKPTLISRSIKRAVTSIKAPDMEYSGSLPDALKARGTIRGDSAESFIEDAQSYILKLKGRVNSDIDGYTKLLVTSLETIKLSSEIFGKYKSQVEELERQIKNREIELDGFGKLIKELEEVR